MYFPSMKISSHFEQLLLLSISPLNVLDNFNYLVFDMEKLKSEFLRTECVNLKYLLFPNSTPNFLSINE